jgi:hypothetical protein
MSVWPGLGFNYKSRNPEVIARDIALFRKLGVRYIRVHIPAFNGTAAWHPDTYRTWRIIAKQFTDAGFRTMFGIGWGNINKAEWQRYHDHCVAEAQYCLETGSCNEFNNGNEGEMHLVDMTQAEFRTRTRALAVAIKAVFPDPNKVIYTFPCFSTYGDGWIAEGIGDGMDYLGGNVYGNYNATTRFYNRNNYRNQIPKMVNGLGDKFILTEFNVEAIAGTYKAMASDVERFEQEFALMYRYIKSHNVLRAYLYQWRAANDNDVADSFYIARSNGTFHPAWNALVTNNGRGIYVK